VSGLWNWTRLVLLLAFAIIVVCNLCGLLARI
jgi:hypothetical protein